MKKHKKKPPVVHETSIRRTPVLRKRKPCVVNVKYDNGSDVVLVDRSTRYGNPFVVGVDGTRKQVIIKFKKRLKKKPKLVARAKKELKGKVLGCHCAPLACHADVWLEVVNARG